MEKTDIDKATTQYLPYLLIALVVILIDQVTKYLIRSFVNPFNAIKALPFLEIVNIRNEGAAFGMFRSLGNMGSIVVAAISIIFVLYLLLKSKEDRVGLALVLGGAAGNLTDRILFGSVTDFIDLFIGRFHWPAFNVADSALTIGIAIIFIKTIRGQTCVK